MKIEFDLYKALESLVLDLRRIDKSFKQVLDSGLVSVPIRVFFEDNKQYLCYSSKDKSLESSKYFGNELIHSIAVTNIFNYLNSEEGYLYLQDVSALRTEEGYDIRVWEVDSKAYPKKDDILIKRGKALIWSKYVEVPESLVLVDGMINSLSDCRVGHIYMNDRDEAVCTCYSISDTISRVLEGDSVLIPVIEWVSSLGFPVSEVFWFPSKCGYLNTKEGMARARKNDSGEYSLVIY